MLRVVDTLPFHFVTFRRIYIAMVTLTYLFMRTVLGTTLRRIQQQRHMRNMRMPRLLRSLERSTRWQHLRRI